MSGVTTATTAHRSARAWLPAFVVLGVIWGTSFLFIKVAVHEVHPLWLTFGRVATGAVTMLVVLLATRDRLPRDPRLWAHLVVVAAVGVAIPFTLFGYGEQRVSSVLAGIWNAATPLVALPLAVVAFRTEKLTARRAVGLAIGFLGVLGVLGVWRGVGGSQLTGQVMCFGAAMCYAVAIPYQKRFIAGRTEAGVAIVTAQLLVAAAQLAVVAPLMAGAPPVPTHLSGRAVLSIVLLGALGTGVAFVLNFRVIRLAGASTSTSVTYLMPLVSTLVGVAILHERLTWNQPVGALVVLAGVAVSHGLFVRRGAAPQEPVDDAESAVAAAAASPPGPSSSTTR